jgi:hypothetical protein
MTCADDQRPRKPLHKRACVSRSRAASTARVRVRLAQTGRNAKEDR